jgi:Zn-dependent alcohol dehydrogenase
VWAVVYEAFGDAPAVRTVADPTPAPHVAVIAVEATGLCRSDWHGWMGHDPDIRRFPHVPGHELAGVVAAVGADVTRWAPGDRVTVPFVCACGMCAQCAAGDHQICDRQTQPGFTHWGSFAELTAIDWADVNLVALPDELDADTAAALGCRFATAYRAVLQVGRVRAGEWVAVHGCGGVGLSAVMIAVAAGARVVAVDVSDPALRPRARRAPRSPSRRAPISARSPAAGRTSRSTRSAAKRCAPRRSRACASAAGTSRSACSRSRRASRWTSSSAASSSCSARTAWPRMPTRRCSPSWRPAGCARTGS